MRTTRTRPKPRRRSPRRNPPSVPDVLRRARAVASLAERLNELGREERVAMEYGSHDRLRAIQAEAEQILAAAERVVREITEILGDG